jgi:predicted Zn-dependent protease
MEPAAITRIRAGLRTLLCFVLVAAARAVAAADPCEPVIAQVVSLQGLVEIQRAGQASWVRVTRLDERLCQGDRLRSGARSRAALLIGPQTLIRVDENTVIALSATPLETRVEFDSGAIYSISRFPRRYRIITPFVNAGVEGTEFLVALGTDHADVAVYEGRVAAEDLVGTRGARTVLQDGQVARFVRGAPAAVNVLVNPMDAVQWALYYPALDPQAIGEAAFELPDCERVVAPERAACLTTRAAKLLRLGRVQAAERDIAAAPDSADAAALAAIIRVVKNDKAGALTLAQQAVARDARSVRGLLALSYAQQAGFRLEDALAAASRAVELEPGNSVAQARRAELLLSVGRLQDAEAAASAAVKANPADSRARTVLGFAQLARFDTVGAREQFLQAVPADASDPLPRLGLGLAAIKDGRLAEGRGEIEIAAALDPQNALLRSYLGKAYSDELSDQLAEEQFGRAKQLDARDPTAWFYNAIRLQALNRPGEALQELHESIERNENRAVYRSQLLLDQDQAARSASRARIYSDLGFDELAVTEAKSALVADPGAFAAHRFLAEAYLQQPGFEIARVSEVLQSQLLQPVNAAALPPQLQQIRSPLLMGSGPITPSFQEFNPLFARDRHTLSLSGVAGSGDTWADEVTYGYYGGSRSFQLGQYRYDTNGFRTNADLRQDFLRAFYQEDLNPQTSFQAELSRAETRGGDIRFQFEPDSFSPTQRGRADTTAFRLGARHSWEPGSTAIGSLISQRQNIGFNDSFVDPLFKVDLDISTTDRSYTGELQYQGRTRLADVVAGGGLFERKETGADTSTLTITGFPPAVMSVPIDTTLRSRNVYAYGSPGHPRHERLVLGLSLDAVDKSDPVAPREDRQLSPKFGVVLPLGQGTTVRLAAFRGIKRLPSATPSIEPTQVAGFNQVFDDVNQTRFWRYGAAVDQSWSGQLFGGVELTRRNLAVPVIPGFPDEDRREWLHRGYVSWLVSRRVAAGAEFLVERIDRNLTIPSGPVFMPVDIDTRSLPLTLSYHDLSGFFARGRLTFVSQEIASRNELGDQQNQSDSFKVFDLSFGTRLPGRRGIISVDVKNLFDEKFRYRDTTFEGLPRVPQYAPQRAVFARVQLSL